MRAVMVSAEVTAGPDDAFARICEFERFPDLCGAIRRVDVDRGAGGETTSSWEVDFRDGTLEWTERDVADPVNRTLTFELVDGDLDHFAGSWCVVEEPGAVRVVFDAELDLGLPTLATIIEPIAERNLRESVAQLLDALFADDLHAVEI